MTIDRRALANGLAVLALAAPPAAGQTAPPPGRVEPIAAQAGPPAADRPLPAGMTLLRPEPVVTCDGAPVSRLAGMDLPPRAASEGVRGGFGALRFRIDAEGRTLDIRPAPSEPSGSELVIVVPARDPIAQATLATWRFAAEAREDCQLSATYTPIPIDQADLDLLLRYFAVTRANGPARDAVARRLAGPDADCQGGRLVEAAYPDFEAGERRPGIQDWTVVRWNVAADGRLTDIETLGSSGDPVLDAEAIAATTESRAEPGRARSGCVYNWFRQGGVLPAPAPASPPPDPMANCPAAVLATFRPRRDVAAPDGFLARGVEGSALVRFDIAPWGEVGNVAVVEAQPAQAFEAAARAVVEGGSAPAGPGAVGCLQPVAFRVPAPG